MKRIHSILPILLAVGLTLTACSRNEPEAVQQQETSDAPSNRVDIPASVRNNLGITFAKVERRKVANTTRVPGTFELQPLARHDYHLMLPGVVEFAVDQFDMI